MYVHKSVTKIYRRKWAIQKEWWARHGFFRRLAYAVSCLLFMSSVAFVNFGLLHRAKADGPDAAVDVLGQLDGNYNKRYDTANADWRPSPNAAGMSFPADIAFDYIDHWAFLLDDANARVMVYQLDNNNKISSYRASWVLGQDDFTTNDNTVDQSHMADPTGVVYDSAHQRLFVSDDVDNRVLVYDLSGGISNGMNASWVLGQPDFSSSNSLLNQSALNSPFGLEYDAANDYLFVADGANDRVMIFDVSGSISNGMNASNVLGEPDFNTDVCAVTQTNLCNPTGVAYDQTNKRLFVGDDLCRALVYDLSGGISNGLPPVNVIGQADFNSCVDNGPQQNSIPDMQDLAYDPAHDYLYIPDLAYCRILVFDLSGGVSDGMNANYVLGEPDFTSNSGCGNSAAQNILGNIWGVGFDTGSGQLFAADSFYNRVEVFDSNTLSNNVNAVDALGQNDGSRTVDWTSSAANNRNYYTSSYMGKNEGTAIDTVNHRLFVSDRENGRVLVYQLDNSNQLIDPSATWVLGKPDFNAKPPPASPPVASQSNLDGPRGLAYDSVNQRLFVVDAEPFWFVGSRVMVFDLSGGISNGMNASNVLGQPDFASDSCNTTQSTLCMPTSAAYDPNNDRLFVGDDNNERVMVYDLAGGVSDGMNASNVLGQADFNSAVCDTTQSIICGSYGVAYDTVNDRLFVNDEGGPRVMVYDLAGGVSDGMNASNVLGQPDFTSFNCCSVDDKSFAYNQGLDYDETTETLFVADADNNRVMAFDFTNGISDDMAASDVIGQPDFSSNTAATDQNTLSEPSAVTYDSGTQNLYVNDTGNNRVMVFSYSDSIAGSPDTTQPSVPTNVQVTATTTTSISLSWDPSTDDTAVTGYHVFRDGVQVGAPAGTSFTDTGLTPATSYDYTISAFDAASNESAQSSPAVQGTTGNNPSPPPPPPTPPPSPSPSPSPGGGGGGSGSSSSGNPGSGSGSHTTEPINLDNQPGYSDGSGYDSTAGTGQEYTFTDSGGNTGSVTVTEVSDGSVIITGDDSNTHQIDAGQKVPIDADGDGRDDLNIQLNNTDNGQASMTFWKILLASTPSGSTSSGHGGGSGIRSTATQAGLLSRIIDWLGNHISDVILIGFPWLLFLLLALTIIRLSYLAWKEHRALKALRDDLQRQQSLSEQKRNFVVLSSHYLRTGLTLITGGVELMKSLGVSPAAASMEQLSKNLGLAVNGIIDQISTNPNTRPTPQAAQLNEITAGKPLRVLGSANFIWPVAGAAALIGFADYLLLHVKHYSASHIHLLIQVAAGLLIVVLLYASLRSARNSKLLQETAQKLLDEQQVLDSARNNLVNQSIAMLSGPLLELKKQLLTVPNPKATKPALEGVSRLEDVLTKFKVVAALQAGAGGAITAPVSLPDLVNQVLNRYQQQLHDKGITVTSNVLVEQVTQDPQLLAFTLDSIISNAVKYSPQGSQLSIDAKGNGHNAQISVHDNGPGITDDKLTQLFQPFSRAEDVSKNFNQQGVGLSLYLDKLIMNYLGGNISLNSAQGSGTTANLSLPTSI